MFFDEFNHFVPIASGNSVHTTVDGFVFVFKDNPVARSTGTWRLVGKFAGGEDIRVFFDKFIVESSSLLRRYCWDPEAGTDS
jgi:hypothetical protein